MPRRLGAKASRPLANSRRLRAKPRIADHFLDVAQPIGPVAELLTPGHGPGAAGLRIAARLADVRDELTKIGIATALPALTALLRVLRIGLLLITLLLRIATAQAAAARLTLLLLLLAAALALLLAFLLLLASLALRVRLLITLLTLALALSVRLLVTLLAFALALLLAILLLLLLTAAGLLSLLTFAGLLLLSVALLAAAGSRLLLALLPLTIALLAGLRDAARRRSVLIVLLTTRTRLLFALALFAGLTGAAGRRATLRQLPSRVGRSRRRAQRLAVAGQFLLELARETIEVLARPSEAFRFVSQHALGSLLDTFAELADALACIGLGLTSFVHEAAVEHLLGRFERLIGIRSRRLAAGVVELP